MMRYAEHVMEGNLMSSAKRLLGRSSPGQSGLGGVRSQAKQRRFPCNDPVIKGACSCVGARTTWYEECKSFESGLREFKSMFRGFFTCALNLGLLVSTFH